MALASGNPGGLEVSGAMLTDAGCVRASNEDAVAFVIPSHDDPKAGRGCLLIVADGMGGHAAGEVASGMAAEIIRQVYYSRLEPVPASLMIAFETANRAILEHAQESPGCKGMGTTCTALVIQSGELFLAHVGDSRAYILRGGKLTQLSGDQTLHAQMIREGLLTDEEAKLASGGNVILQALGTSPRIHPAVWENGIPLAADDILVLCSDGLWNLVEDTIIAELAGRAEPQEACQRLISAALEKGGYDNVSVGIFAMRPADGAAASPQSATRRIEVPAPEPAPEAAATRSLELPEGLA
ncbi:MAG: protein phosphatase 2C domain-containing protein [Beijerinckiaceae bacterium]|nr:protein phosphatase 2C domain-containing protein [Beijerinckiaceae bacterium]